VLLIPTEISDEPHAYGPLVHIISRVEYDPTMIEDSKHAYESSSEFEHVIFKSPVLDDALTTTSEQDSFPVHWRVREEFPSTVMLE
jgi:hypothetical protein